MDSMKPEESESIKRCLLAMLATVPLEPAICPTMLDRQQWTSLQLIARQHRLEPLLHQRFRKAASWRAMHRKSASRVGGSLSQLCNSGTGFAEYPDPD